MPKNSKTSPPLSQVTRRAVLASGMSALALPFLAPGAGWGQSSQREVEGGIGGTGIVGLLTDFGSLIVSGRRVETDGSTRVTDAFGRVREKELLVGHSLTVEAAGPADALRARRVHVTYPLIGSVGEVWGDGTLLSVNGVTVRIERRLRGIGAGDRVAVSGIWRGNDVIGSRVTRTRQTLDLVSGDIAKGRDGARVGGVLVRGPGTASSASGDFGEALGSYDPDSATMRVQNLSTGRFNGAAGPLQNLSVEGYLNPSAQAPGYRIAGLGHSFARNLQLARFAESRVLFDGPYTGRFAANRALVLPESSEARRRVLRARSRA